MDAGMVAHLGVSNFSVAQVRFRAWLHKPCTPVRWYMFATMMCPKVSVVRCPPSLPTPGRTWALFIAVLRALKPLAEDFAHSYLHIVLDVPRGAPPSPPLAARGHLEPLEIFGPWWALSLGQCLGP